jgi:hypothetical protein
MGKVTLSLEAAPLGGFLKVSLDVFIGGTIYENKMSVNSKQGELHIRHIAERVSANTRHLSCNVLKAPQFC